MRFRKHMLITYYPGQCSGLFTTLKEFGLNSGLRYFKRQSSTFYCLETCRAVLGSSASLFGLSRKTQSQVGLSTNNKHVSFFAKRYCGLFCLCASHGSIRLWKQIIVASWLLLLSVVPVSLPGTGRKDGCQIRCRLSCFPENQLFAGSLGGRLALGFVSVDI